MISNREVNSVKTLLALIIAAGAATVSTATIKKHLLIPQTNLKKTQANKMRKTERTFDETEALFI